MHTDSLRKVSITSISKTHSTATSLCLNGYSYIAVFIAILPVSIHFCANHLHATAVLVTVV